MEIGDSDIAGILSEFAVLQVVKCYLCRLYGRISSKGIFHTKYPSAISSKNEG